MFYSSIKRMAWPFASARRGRLERDRGAEDSDQTRGKTGLCDLVDRVGLQVASLLQGVERVIRPGSGHRRG